jgi:cyclopropane-fatty-acyl-phospholipid synthase
MPRAAVPTATSALFKPLVLRQVRGLRSGLLTVRDRHGAAQLGQASGLRATIDVKSPGFYRAVALGGTVGAAESYARGDWEADDLVALFRLFARDRSTSDRIESGLASLRGLLLRGAHVLRSGSKRYAARNIAAHYDLGNEFFAAFLDPTMTYSAGIFEREDSTMEEASVAKIDRLCAKLRLSADDHLLEIGTGWGALAIRAARRFGCRVTTVTLSVEQARWARDRVARENLGDRIEVRVADYRTLSGRFDKLVSVEMIEAVGHRRLGEFFCRCSQLLRPEGLMALQAITVVDQRYRIARRQVDVIQQLLFPGSDIPSITAMLDAATAASDLRLVQLEDITGHYERTLHEWRRQFQVNRAAIQRRGASEQFCRLWDYYLAYCEAGFAERYTGNVQMVLARPGCRTPPLLARLESFAEDTP